METNVWFINRVDKVREIRVLTFRALTLRQSEWKKPDEGLTLKTSALESFYGGQITLSILLIKPRLQKRRYYYYYFFFFCVSQVSGSKREASAEEW